MPSWGVGPAVMVTLSPPRVVTAAISTTAATTTTTANKTQTMMTRSKEASLNDLTIIITVVAIAAILVIILIITLLLLYKRRRHYKDKKDADMELKQPLNYQSVAAAPSSPVPADHLAKLDEFSTISATLGPSVPDSKSSNKMETSKRQSQASGAKLEEGATFEHPIFNRKKQRPASSISEVLEELERRQNHRNSTDFTENPAGKASREGDMPWDPQTDAHTPLSYEDITFFNTPLLAPIPDENEDSHVSSLSEQNSFFKEKPGDNSSFPSVEGSPGNHNSMLDGNGDSGYEAESRPEITEDDITPMGEEDDMDEDDGRDHKTYDTSSFDPEDSPILTSPSRQRLLKRSSQDT